MSSKRIFIDATGIVPIPDGLGKYSYYLLNSVLKNDNFNFTVLHQMDLPQTHSLFLLHKENVEFVPVRIPVIGPNRDISIFKLRNKINKHDLFHCLSSYFPIFGVSIPSIITVHDLKYLLYSDFFGNKIKEFYYSWVIRRGITRTKHIIAVSSATKRDLLNLGVPSEKITVIHEAATISSEERESDYRLTDINGVEQPYLLFVGVNRPHKNVSRIIEACGILRDNLGKECPGFVFVGARFDTLRQRYASVDKSKKLIFLGAVSDEKLKVLYKHAFALVFPSLYEGFGLPILEAMVMGVPVITSNCSSMPEVAGDAAILIDPHKVGQLVAAMLKIVQDETERIRLRQAGLRHVRKFLWERVAYLTIKLYETLLFQ
ncbi:glycosyltransferase family 4 protein [bacterium]|nr:glycosyltransferase family 4 protein [candidate division WOR-3 bacterium]MCK4818975.1 glycosyltransferase family 4 protein [bacterium]